MEVQTFKAQQAATSQLLFLEALFEFPKVQCPVTFSWSGEAHWSMFLSMISVYHDIALTSPPFPA